MPTSIGIFIFLLMTFEKLASIVIKKSMPSSGDELNQ
jgi:hypothetical protein